VPAGTYFHGQRGQHRLRAGDRAYLNRHVDEVQPECQFLWALGRLLPFADEVFPEAQPAIGIDGDVCFFFRIGEVGDGQDRTALPIHHMSPTLRRCLRTFNLL